MTKGASCSPMEPTRALTMTGDRAAVGYPPGEYGLVAIECAQRSSREHVLDVSLEPML